MTDLSRYGDRRMTVKEVAEALGLDPRTIQIKVKELFPDIVRERETTYLDEAQATAVKKACEKRFAATTRLERAQMVADAMRILQEDLAAAQAEIATLAPRAAAADRIEGAQGLKTLAEIGKINGLGPRKIIVLLLASGILYRKGRALLPYQEHVECGRFVVRERTFTINEQEHLYSQTYVTGKGEVWLARQFFPAEARP